MMADTHDTLHFPADLAPEIHIGDGPEMAPDLALRCIARLAPGLSLLPYTPETTAAMVRQEVKTVLLGWLRLGLYLYRARLHMGSEEFSAWFRAQEFPISLGYARQAIAAARHLIADPTLERAAHRLTSVKHFQIVARVLKEPDQRAEFSAAGTVYGKPLEEIDQLSQRDLLALKADQERAGPQPPAQQQGQQLPLLPVQELIAERARLEAELTRANEQLARTSERLLKVQNPDLHAPELEADFLKILSDAKSHVSVVLGGLNPTFRRDLDALSPAAVVEFYATAILFERQAGLLARQIESKYAARVPSVLEEHTGELRTPASRATLRLMEEQIASDHQALGALRAGGKVTLIDGNAEVLFEQ